MKRILVIDDEAVIINVLRRMISRSGHSIASADSGFEGIRMFSENTYDLVLLDVLLPDMDGFQIARKMKNLKSDQKIIMVTGLYEESVSERLDSEGIDVAGVISKPFTASHITSLIGEM